MTVAVLSGLYFGCIFWYNRHQMSSEYCSNLPESSSPSNKDLHDDKKERRLANLFKMVKEALRRIVNDPVILPDPTKPLFDELGEISSEQPKKFRDDVERRSLTTSDAVPMFDSPYSPYPPYF